MTNAAMPSLTPVRQPLGILILAGESATRWRGIETRAARERSATILRCSGPIQEIHSLCSTLRPSVLVADLDCIQALLDAHQAKWRTPLPGVRILVETLEADQALIECLLRKGCWGVVSPEAPARILWKAVQSVAAGQYWVSRAMLTQIARRHILAHALGLTSRETEILQLVAQGCRNHEIAQRLFISVETVRWHLRSLYNKLGVHDRFSAAMYASGVLESAEDAGRSGAEWVATGSD